MTYYLPLDSLRSNGYLAEVNREFFHPLGLALAVMEDESGDQELAVLDYRDEPEGVIFGPDALADIAQKHHTVAELRKARFQARMEALGFWIQPPGVTSR